MEMKPAIIQKHNFSQGEDLPSPSKSASVSIWTTIPIVVIRHSFSRVIVATRKRTVSFRKISINWLRFFYIDRNFYRNRNFFNKFL